MPPSSPPGQPSIRPPHPLALALIERLRPGSRVLEFCTGSGRNLTALRAAGLEVAGIADETAAGFDGSSVPGGFDAILSTHGLLHGTSADIAARTALLGGLLMPGGSFYAVFGSTGDARFGRGERIAASTFAPLAGDERGIAHTYFTRSALSALLRPHLAIDSLDERNADAIAGSWAHPAQPLRGAVHWFVTAHRA
jgi:hypothetical protein